jgi:hypothetical protein
LKENNEAGIARKEAILLKMVDYFFPRKEPHGDEGKINLKNYVIKQMGCLANF